MPVTNRETGVGQQGDGETAMRVFGCLVLPAVYQPPTELGGRFFFNNNPKSVCAYFHDKLLGALLDRSLQSLLKMEALCCLTDITWKAQNRRKW